MSAENEKVVSQFIIATIMVPRSLWAKIKAIATEQDKRLEEVVKELLEEQLK